jgi:hypothetical protein
LPTKPERPAGFMATANFEHARVGRCRNNCCLNITYLE